MSKQPDRFERVAHILVQKLMGAEVFEFNGATLDQVENAEALVVTLLRREHASIRRMIAGTPNGLNPTIVGTDWGKGYTEACRHILAALDTRRRSP